MFKTGNIEVRKAGSKGLGVFATKNIRKGEIVEIAPLIVLLEAEDTYIQETKLRYYIFDAGGDIALALGYGSVYNHNDNSNVDYHLLKRDRKIVYTAVRAIKKGSELTINYGWTEYE